MSSSDEVNGDDRLYIKGGDGSVVFIDAFNDAELASLRNEMLTKKWLVNEASLTFYIDRDEDAMGNVDSEEEPERIYIFDATNNKPILDYYADNSTNSDVKKNKSSFGGIIQREKVEDINGNKKGIKYKIRITQHINNLINSTDTNLNKNVRLGLTVTENIAYSNNYYYKSPRSLNNTIMGTNDAVEYFPVASIMEQQGVVLHGTNPSSADASKKLKLVIHYTKPN